MQKKYEKMHLIYQHSIDKVKMINQSSKVVLSKLQEVSSHLKLGLEMYVSECGLVRLKHSAIN